MKYSKSATILLVGFFSLLCRAQNSVGDVQVPTRVEVDTSEISKMPEIASSAPATSAAAVPKNAPVPTVVLTSPEGAGYNQIVANSIKDCNSSSSTAHTSCLTELNPSIQKASGMIGLLISGIGTMTSTSESCGKYNKALKLAETALTAYNTMCGAGQMSCSSTCDTSKTSLTDAITSLEAAQKTDSVNSVSISKDIAALRGTLGLIGSKLTTCQGYKMNLAAAGVGLMNVVKQSGMASQCQAQTATDCTKDPTNVACKTAAIDCTKAENSSNTQCICMANPASPGCAGYTGQSTAYPTASATTTPTATDSSTAVPNLGGVDSGVTAGAASGSGSGSAALGSSGGGGGGGLGSGGTNANAKAGGADGKKEKMSANILSGYEGGGGGGGRGGGSGSVNSAYNAYLPGGAKDPSRGLASQTFGNGEVTAAGSKSNWEKVSERYMDNKPTLVGP